MENQQSESSGARVLSIDALRGFDMFWIIGGGAIFESLAEIWKHPITETINVQLGHVRWEGFHFEDLIFPLFVFVMGAVLPFSMGRRRQRGQGLVRVHVHVIRRTALLLLLGLIFNGLLEFNWSEMRWPGVLQRIALCYFFAALIVIHTRWRAQAILVAAVLLLYWAVTMLIPVPGHGAGNLTMEGCLSSWIDQQVIPGLLYYTFGDNEGLISTFPAVCTALAGSAGGAVAAQRSHRLSQGSGPGGGRGSVCGRWVCLGLRLPHHQDPVDQFLRPIRGRMEPPTSGRVLLGDRCAGISQVGVLLRRDRNERYHDLLPATLRRFRGDRRVLRGRAGRPCRSAWGHWCCLWGRSRFAGCCFGSSTATSCSSECEGRSVAVFLGPAGDARVQRHGKVGDILRCTCL